MLIIIVIMIVLGAAAFIYMQKCQQSETGSEGFPQPPPAQEEGKAPEERKVSNEVVDNEQAAPGQTPKAPKGKKSKKSSKKGKGKKAKMTNSAAPTGGEQAPTEGEPAPAGGESAAPAVGNASKKKSKKGYGGSKKGGSKKGGSKKGGSKKKSKKGSKKAKADAGAA